MTVTRSRFAPQENSLYETEEWATQCVLRHFPVAGRRVWEPAAGRHKMADVLRAAGADVVTSDIATYDRDHDFLYDFLHWLDCPDVGEVDGIYSNPPFGPGNRLAQRFVELALERCAGTVAMLLTAKFDFGNTRHHLFRDNRRFAAKIALVDRIQWFPGEYGGTEDHAWYIWTSTAGAGLGRPALLYEGILAT